MTLSIQAIYHWMTGWQWIMNWKRCSNRSWPNSGMCLEGPAASLNNKGKKKNVVGPKKTTKNLTIVSVPAKIRTGHLQNTSQMCYLLSGPLSPQHGMSSGCEWGIWRILQMSSFRHTRRGGPPALGLGGELTTHHKETACYEMLHRALDVNGFFGTS
jgi:hypothetical protein